MMHLAKRDRINPAASWGIRLAAFVLGLLVCGVLAFIMIEKLQQNPGKIGEFYQCFIRGIYSDNAASILANRKLWQFLKNIAILLCIALAITPAFRMRFWNIGAEGQTLVGVLAATAVTVYGGGRGDASILPEWLLIILMFFAAILASAVWGLIPAIFKAKWNTNETLFTLMMNYVATYLVSYCLIKWVPSGSSALGEMKYGHLPNIPLYAENANAPANKYFLIIVLVFMLAGMLYIYLKRFKHGYELTVVGESERTARYIGISVKRVTIRTMILSGALCGFAGFLIAAGLDHSVTTESAGGQGFTAIMVSWLANFNPLAMILTAAVIVFLNQGASQISTTFGVSGAFPSVVVGVMLFFIIGSEFFIRYKICFGHKERTSPINRRNVVTCVILTIITGGIYGIYWYYLLVKNVRAIEKKNGNCAGEMLCLIFVPFYSIYWWYTRGKAVTDHCAADGYSVKGNEFSYILLSIHGFGIISMAIMQGDFNALPSENAQSI